jgi:predicted type IV restriction endonuclease
MKGWVPLVRRRVRHRFTDGGSFSKGGCLDPQTSAIPDRFSDHPGLVEGPLSVYTAPMPDLRDKLPELIQRYERDRTKPRTEADVSANFIDYLFAALGWDVTNPNEYNRQRYVREAGFADIGLLLGGEPRLFVEVKRFGLIPKSTERTGDRTPEEKQAFKYARQEKIKWAVLTNFERLHVFDADQERLILAFDDPQDYLRRIEDLNRLAKANIERDSLEHLGQLQAKEDLDRGFLESLKRWRKLLAQNILDHNPNNEVLLTDGQPDLDKLRRVVQRILDRLVIIRYADDRELLDDFGVIEAMHAGFKARRSYADEGKLYRDFLDFCAGMDRKHNTEIFSPKHPCQQVTVSNDCLDHILAEITAISFRKFTSDVLGNTYETYLGHRLELKDGRIDLSERRDLRKGAGIFYTPPYIVRYIVDNTLGRKLEELKAQHGLSAGHEARKLKVLDPACGSGSFLIYAFDVLAKFYEGCNERISAEKVHLLKDSKPGELLATQEGIKSLPPLLLSYPKIILQENLYGVDLDEEAAELASVNLIMKAFDRVSSNGRKLPLILNQNVKVGNSLIGYALGAEFWKKNTVTDKNLEHLISLRQQVCTTDDDNRKRELLEDAADEGREIAEPLEVPLRKMLPDLITERPLHWPVEFPEVFAKSGKGFSLIVGNPPYGDILSAKEKKALVAVGFESGGSGNNDIFRFFVERAASLLTAKGLMSFIIPNPCLGGPKYKNYRKRISAISKIDEILDFKSFKVFGDADVFTHILRLSNQVPESVYNVTCKISPDGKVDEVPRSTCMIKPGSDTAWQPTGELLGRVLASDRFQPLSSIADSRDVGINYQRHGVGWQERTRSKIAEAIFYEGAKQDKRDYPYIKGEDIERHKVLPKACRWLRRNYTEFASKNESVSVNHEWAQKNPKIVSRQTADEIICAVDEDCFYTGRSVHATVLLDKHYNIFFLTALLNSKLLTYFYRGFSQEEGRAQAQVILDDVRRLPIPDLNFKKKQDKQEHDELAQLGRNERRQVGQKACAEAAFSEALNNHPHEWRELGDTYWNRPEYVKLIGKKSHVKPNDASAVTGFRCEMLGETIEISAQMPSGWKPVLDMTIVDQKVRLFILYGIRQFLRDNSRKRKWGEGKLLALTLETIQVPVFLSHGVHHVETQLRTLKLVLAEMKKRSSLLNPTELEGDIASTDEEINRRVYDLYGLAAAERTLVEDSFGRPERKAPVAQQKT